MEGVGEEVYIFGFFAAMTGYLVYKTIVYFLYKLTTEATGQEEETDISRRGRTLSTPHQCSICLEDAQLAVETNCGHVFCSNCLLEVWRRSSQLFAISCPYCRQRITLMLPYFTQEENNAVDPALAGDRRRLVKEMKGYNQRNSGEPRSVMEQMRDLPMLLRHLLTRLIAGVGFLLLHSFRVRISVLVAMWVLYLLSPLDPIPLPKFGLLVGLVDSFIFLAAHFTFRQAEEEEEDLSDLEQEEEEYGWPGWNEEMEQEEMGLLWQRDGDSEA